MKKVLIALSVILILVVGLVFGYMAGYSRNQAVVQTVANVAPTSQSTPEPTPVSTPVPTPVLTPSPTPLSTPVPSSPTPVPTPVPLAPTPVSANLPRITKNPGSEIVEANGKCQFVTRYENADIAEWHFVSPDGTTDISYSTAQVLFPTLKIINGYAKDMTLENIPAELNGWKVYCRFSNTNGYTDTFFATITVLSRSNVNSQKSTISPALSTSMQSEPLPAPTPPPTPKQEIEQIRIMCEGVDITSEESWPTMYVGDSIVVYATALPNGSSSPFQWSCSDTVGHSMQYSINSSDSVTLNCISAEMRNVQLTVSCAGTSSTITIYLRDKADVTDNQ